MDDEKIKEIVRKGYARIARRSAPSPCCAGNPACDCSGLAEGLSRKVGYSEEEINSVPDGANLGLGCGNPVALASLKKGETVLDLGSGAGFDCFLAAERVGTGGKVIGIDMTSDMIKKASRNARKGKYQNVEFRLGDIENLPVSDSSVDVIISNCVINLVPDKRRAFAEAFRALKPGGRIMVSDIVLLEELPAAIKQSVEAYIGCLSGAVMKEAYLDSIRSAGFQEVRVVDETSFPIELMANDPTAQAIISNLGIRPELIKGIAESVLSIKVCGIKPAST